MTNTYFKMLNNSINRTHIDSVIDSVQNSLREITRLKDLENSDMYDAIKNLENNPSSNKTLEINHLLKFYVLNQILKDSKETLDTPKVSENIFLETSNPNIKINSKDNKYYKLVNETFVKDESIQSINEDGSYVVIKVKSAYSYKIKELYDVNENLLSIQLLTPEGNIENNKWHVAEYLGIKKVLDQKYKYAGYSGNSTDLLASFLNKFCNPIETGFYMDKSYKLFKWSSSQKCFIRNFSAESKSPLLTDYEFTNEIIIRKEYTGITK